jgi:molybdate-binding protein
MSRRYAEGLAGHDVRLFPLARRRQGLIVARGNPKRIDSVAALARGGVRIVNRQRGSGTRALFEFLLSEAGVDRESLPGYDNEEITHSAVAALVAGRQADAGFGLEAASAQFGLDFVPVATERYFLAFDAASLGRADMRKLLAAAGDSRFHAAVDAIPGYRSLGNSGLVTVTQALGAALPLQSPA